MEERAPFVFGKLPDLDFFTNREDEMKRLNQNFLSGTNTILISPRRWGKSTLVKNAADLFVKKHKNYRYCLIDLFNIQTEEDFYRQLGKQIIKATAGNWKNWLNEAMLYLSAFKPSISLSGGPEMDIELSVTKGDIQHSFSHFLDLAENIAIKKEIKIIICIDEFQNIERFSNPLGFQQKLRAHFQHHKHVTYCIYGSKRHMMMHLFESRSMPFYKFGDTFYLGKISINHWIPFITNHFKSTKKSISIELVVKLVEYMDEHPFYVQQLAQLTWLRTKKTCTLENLENALQDLMDYNLPMFIRDYESLSPGQVNFLKALANKVKSFNSGETIALYKLNSTANVKRLIEALENKEIIDKIGKQIAFADPAFEIWFKKMYHIQTPSYIVRSNVNLIAESKVPYKKLKKRKIK